MRIRWTVRASRDLDSIHAFIASDSYESAGRTVLDIIAAIGHLRDSPASGRPGRVVGTRELVIPRRPYIVPYRVRENTIEILRVFHTYRKIENIYPPV